MKIRLLTASGINQAISNLWYGDECDIMQFQDAIEDSKNGAEMVRNLNRLRIFNKFTLDRETETTTRLKTVDYCGNVSYLVVSK